MFLLLPLLAIAILPGVLASSSSSKRGAGVHHHDDGEQDHGDEMECAKPAGESAYDDETVFCRRTYCEDHMDPECKRVCADQAGYCTYGRTKPRKASLGESVGGTEDHDAPGRGLGTIPDEPANSPFELTPERKKMLKKGATVAAAGWAAGKVVSNWGSIMKAGGTILKAGTAALSGAAPYMAGGAVVGATLWALSGDKEGDEHAGGGVDGTSSTYRRTRTTRTRRTGGARSREKQGRKRQKVVSARSARRGGQHEEL